MGDIKTIQISQYQETPTTTIHHPNLVYRFAYARSADSQALKLNGQDYLEIRENQQRLVFVLCDGVGSSFFGDFAARFLGDHLLEWLWNNDAMYNIGISELENYLQTLTVDATEQVNKYELPSNATELVRMTLESMRVYGSECMFVAGVVDVNSNGAVLMRMGDIRIRLWESFITEYTTFGSKPPSTARWSTRNGPIRRCEVFIVPPQGFSRLAVYSDGLARLDQWKGYMPRKPELDSLIHEASNAPSSDDISFFEIMLPTSLERNFEEHSNLNISSFQIDENESQTLLRSDVLVEPQLKLSRPLRVFLCHALQDKPRVRKLYKQLRSDLTDPWLDEEKLLPGQNWRNEITKAVRSSDVILVCLSGNSISKEGFVQSEIRLALDVATEKPDGTIFLIPLRLEECEVPDLLRHLQWVNYFEDKGFERLIKALHARAENLGLTNVLK